MSTIIDGQVDIFGDVFTDPRAAQKKQKAEQKQIRDERRRRKADQRPWTCLACGEFWPDPHLATDGREGLIEWHTRGMCSYATAGGRCGTQRLYLDWLNVRRDSWRRKSVKWGRESDILGLILQAKIKGCTDKEITAALAVPWDET